MPENYPHLGWSIPTYRWLIFNRRENGFSTCLLKVGTKWVIDLEQFESWLDSHQETV